MEISMGDYGADVLKLAEISSGLLTVKNAWNTGKKQGNGSDIIYLKCLK